MFLIIFRDCKQVAIIQIEFSEEFWTFIFSILNQCTAVSSKS